MSARDDILARLPDALPADRIAARAAALLANPERPLVPPEERTARFLQQLAGASVAATVEQVAGWADLPQAVAAYLAAEGLPTALYLPPQPRLRALDWGGLTIHDTCAPDESAALALARAAVAETGSLVFETDATAPMLPNFLTLHHLVVVPTEAIVGQLEDAPGDLASTRAHYWVTGVSGTTDIEGQYVRGAHGPRFLHVLLVG